MNKLDQEESEILEAFESGKVKRAKDSSNIQKRHQLYAEAMFKKDARINIRLPSKDLRGLQTVSFTNTWKVAYMRITANKSFNRTRESAVARFRGNVRARAG